MHRMSFDFRKFGEIATNDQIEIFAKENLFEPMGISNYNWTFEPNQERLL